LTTQITKPIYCAEKANDISDHIYQLFFSVEVVIIIRDAYGAVTVALVTLM
jgi:hypothetical protein